MKISVAITTRNREQVLRLCLNQFAKHRIDAEYIVMDDNSQPSMEQLVMSYDIPITYLRSNQQIGVAHAKNQCLKRMQDCDYIFLFDDDCFPVKDNWHEFYIKEHLRTGQHHFIYNLNGALRVMRVHSTINGIETFQTGTGCFMFITKKVIEKLGGFNTEYGMWGHEHNGYSRRVYNSRLNQYGPFLSPVGSSEYIYSLDLQNVPAWAKSIITTKFKSAEAEWWKKLQCREKRTVKAYEYDCRTNYYQPL